MTMVDPYLAFASRHLGYTYLRKTEEQPNVQCRLLGVGKQSGHTLDLEPLGKCGLEKSQPRNFLLMLMLPFLPMTVTNMTKFLLSIQDCFKSSQ